MEEDKPFACTVPECGMRFINEDHLVVHSKKHELSLSLPPTSAFKNTFVDQTPTPTRFLNAFESELFQDLHSDNPFEVTFRRANSLVANSPPITIPESSSLISGLPDTEPLSTPSITLNSDGDVPLLTPQEPNVISLKKPAPRMEKNNSLEESSETLPFEPSTHLFSNSKENEKNDGNSNNHLKKTCLGILTEENSSSSKEVELSTGRSTVSGAAVVQTPVITSIGSCTKNNATCVPTAVVVTRSVTNDVPSLSSSVSQMSVIAKPISDSGDVAQPLVQSVTVAPVVQLIIRLPDGQAMPVQFPMVTIAASAPTTNTHSVKSVANTFSSTTTSSSLAKLKLKQVLTSSQKVGQKKSNNGLPLLEQTVMTGTNNISLSPSSSQNGLDNVFSETPPSSPHSIHRPASSGRRRRGLDDDPEEKRRKSLERNRAAATRCRQKRKQWIQTLGKKADELAATNVHLQNEVNMLRNEVAHLKTMLLAHKDCPVTQQQKATGRAEV